MSLSLFLPKAGVTDLLTTWPDEPRVYERGRTGLDDVMAAVGLEELMDTGCVPAEEVAAICAGPSDRHSFKTNGRTDAAKLRGLRERGYTIRLGNLQRWLPFFHRASQAIQQETCYSNYLHAFFTPAGEQGLLHHWDQQMAIIVQWEGSKTWQLWKPPVDAPMREYNESFRVWREDFIPQWEAAGPDLTIELRAGQSLLLPRGWVHNPHALGYDEPSVHLTVAIRERTPLWLAEQLTRDLIEDPGFRRIILPSGLTGAALGHELEATRSMLIAYLQGLDPVALAERVRRAALTELEYAT
jgi:hypothetical protein